ncbi:MAG: RnfABCDGE type electron transport complex subunit D [Thermoplasmata archaeon]|nr:RnfABCDGE type electron transport complex subunit D [Thermoplasmata archaeon]
MLWIALAILGVYGGRFFGNGIGVLPLLIFPSLAAIVDVAFQRYRFASVRVPDAAIVTGLFLALILPPTAPLAAGATLAIGMIALRHALRTLGRPWFNPAATGILLSAFLFGIPPAWWGSISLPLTVLLGGVVLVWNRRNWELPLAILGAYAIFTVLAPILAAAFVGSPASSSVLLLAATDPAILFFGLFMVPEPRSAPSRRSIGQPVYAVAIALGTAMGLFVLPSVAGIVALLLANLGAAGFRVSRALRLRSDETRPAATPLRRNAERWTVPMRVTAVFAVLLLLAFAVPLATVPGSPGVPLVSSGPPPVASAGGPASATACVHDSKSISASTLSSLHQVLGPSVILSDDPSTGVVVFFDPVNDVTVTETDLYEDFGSAEFNGDDYTVSGCAPG